MNDLIEYKISNLFKTLASLLLLTFIGIQSAHAVPGDVLFEDDFETGTLVGKWTVDNTGGGDAGVSANTVVSGSRSLYTRWDTVVVTSNTINAVVPGVMVNIYVRRGTDALDPDSEYPENDEHLIIEYFNGTSFQNLDTFLGDGAGSSPQGEVFNRSYQLPADALHAALQIRIRQTSGDGGPPANGGVGWDYWHIDDVEVIETALADPLVSSYSLDDSSFTTVTDTSGSGFDGAAVGNATPTTVNPVVAGSPGTCGYAEIARNTNANTIDAINTGVDVNSIGNRGTISLWYKSNEDWDGGEDRMLIDASTNIGSGGNRKYFFLVLRDNSQLRFGLEDTNDSDFILNTGDNDTINQDEWVHIAITWDMPGDSLQIFVNGNLAANSTPNTNGALADTLGSIFLGDNSSNYQASGSSGRSANGSIDEVYFYSEVRSAAQIQANRDFTRPCAPVPLTCGPIPNDFPVFSTGDDLDIDEDNPPIQIVTGTMASPVTNNVVQGDDNGNAINVNPIVGTGVGDVINGSYPAALPTIEPPTFPATGSFNVTVNNVSTGVDLTIDINDNPPGDSSYNEINVNANAELSFTGGGPFYIDRLRVEEGATIDFNAGTYFIDRLEVRGDAATITTNGFVRLFIGDRFTTNNNGDNLTVNATGTVSDLVVFLYPNARFDMDGEALNFTGVIYGPQSGDIKINDDSTITGAIIGGDKIELDEGVTIIYNDTVKAAVASITTCEGPLLSHYAITDNGSGTGITCVAKQITITGHDTSDVDVAPVAGTVINLSTNPVGGYWASIDAGTGTLVPGVSATYTWPGGETSVTLNLNYTNPATDPESVDIDVTMESENLTVDFSRAGFIVVESSQNPATINSQIANKPSNVAPNAQTLYLQAVRASDSDASVCEPVFQNQSVSVDLGAECTNPSSCAAVMPARQISINGTAIATSDDNAGAGAAAYTNFPMLAFDNESKAAIVINYTDAGQMSLHARHNIINADSTASGDYMSGSSGFLVRPFGFFVSVTGNPGATDHTGTAFIRAGEMAGDTFEAIITAYQWAAGEDMDTNGIPDYFEDADPTNNDTINNNGTTPNFGNEAMVTKADINLTATHVHPAVVNGGTAGSLNGVPNPINATNGVATSGNVLRYSEVGVVQIDASTDATNDYFGEAIQGSSTHVGRFFPNHFTVANPFLTQRSDILACMDPFTYMDEPMELTFDIEARNADGNLTQNYEELTIPVAYDYAYLDQATEINFGAINDPAGTPTALSARLLQNSSSGSFTNGTGNITTEIILARDATEDGPFSDLRIGVNPIDDGNGIGNNVSLAATSLDLDPAISGGDTHQQVAVGDVRFGRLNIGSAFGSELVDLTLPVTTQYFTNNGYIVNPDDNCTALTDAPNGVLMTTYGHFFLDDATAYTGNLSPTETTPTLSALTLATGQSSLNLTAPGIGNDGSVNIDVLLTNAGIPLVQPWLQFDWDGDGNHDNDPTATATFGIYRGNDSTIYLRELY